MRRISMGDILKEAIADAKAVRETALENAKMALEEAFTPQIKSMLSAKLKEEEDDDKEEGMHDEGEHDDEAEEGEHEEGMREDDDEAEEGEHEEGMREDDEDEAEEGRHDAEEGMHDEDDDMEEDLDLEAVIKELEAELSEGEDDEVEEKEDDAEEGRGMKEEEEIEEEYEIDEAALEEDEELEEVDKSSAIGKGTGRGNTDRSSGIGSGGQEKAKKFESVQAELAEYKEAVSFLKDKLHEVNILNAKLLFTNKLFKEFALDNNQKLKVVETFDRTQSTREIKLVYSTLAEQFSDNGSINKRNPIKESASSTIGSTKPSIESRKVISEEAQVADRFRKLAGLIK